MGERCLYWECSGLHLPAFGLNTERYFASLHIHSKCRKYEPEKPIIQILFMQWIAQKIRQVNTIAKTSNQTIIRSFNELIFFWQNLKTRICRKRYDSTLCSWNTSLFLVIIVENLKFLLIYQMTCVIFYWFDWITTATTINVPTRWNLFFFLIM